MATNNRETCDFKTRIGRVDVYAVNEVNLIIAEACLAVAMLGFQRTSGQLKQTVDEHIRNGELYIGIQDEKIVAFRILQEKLPGVIYLAGAVKSPDAQKRIVTEMTSYLLGYREVSRVLTRTGSGYVVEEMLSLCQRVRPYDRRCSREDVALVGAVGLDTGNMDRETMVIPEYYGGEPMLNPKAGRPLGTNQLTRSFMKSVMSDRQYFSGAAIILVGEQIKK